MCINNPHADRGWLTAGEIHYSGLTRDWIQHEFQILWLSFQWRVFFFFFFTANLIHFSWSLNKRPVGLLSFAPFGPFWVRGEDSGQCLGSNWCFWRCGKNDEAIHRGKWLQLLTHLPLEKSRHFGDNILWCILVNEKHHILIKSYSELEESLDFLIVSCFNVSIFLIKEFATLARPCFE